MFEIRSARSLSSEVQLFIVEAPRIARHRKAGQFVIVRLHEHGERIPLTIADADEADGTITLVVQGVGKTTKALNALGAGDTILDVVGPLGRPSEIARFGTVVVVGGGVGTAIAWPVAAALKRAGNRVVTIIGAKTKRDVILEDELGAVSDVRYVTTDDGTAGERGLVTRRLAALVEGGGIDRVVAIGPVPMMAAVAELTRPRGIPTIVSLNPIMIDGTGMCGGCRVHVTGGVAFACVDGPEFDAHTVDFEILAQRNTIFELQERAALERYECRLARTTDG